MLMEIMFSSHELFRKLQGYRFQEACQINDLDHWAHGQARWQAVSEACQINDLDHAAGSPPQFRTVSEACQINDLDHAHAADLLLLDVSEACQINDLDHRKQLNSSSSIVSKPVRSMT